jgi:hypothetical protein
MYDPNQLDPLGAQLRVLRIIHFALCLGCISFLVIVLFTAPVSPPGAMGPTFAYLGAGLAVPLFLASWLLPLKVDAELRKKARKVGGRANWEQLFITRFLIRAAPLEGAAFLQLIFYQLQAEPLNLGMALGALVLLVLLFPTRSGMEEWVANQEERTRQESTG